MKTILSHSFFSSLKVLCVPSPSFFSLPAGVFGLSSVSPDNDDVNVVCHIFALFSRRRVPRIGGFQLGPVSLFLGTVGFACGPRLVPLITTFGVKV